MTRFLVVRGEIRLFVSYDKTRSYIFVNYLISLIYLVI